MELFIFGIEEDLVDDIGSVAIFFEESFLCNLRNEINILTKEDLLKELQKKIISCKNVDFTIFGLSLASINTIVSIILSIITLKKYLNYEKSK